MYRFIYLYRCIDVSLPMYRCIYLLSSVTAPTMDLIIFLQQTVLFILYHNILNSLTNKSFDLLSIYSCIVEYP